MSSSKIFNGVSFNRPPKNSQNFVEKAHHPDETPHSILAIKKSTWFRQINLLQNSSLRKSIELKFSDGSGTSHHFKNVLSGERLL